MDSFLGPRMVMFKYEWYERANHYIIPRAALVAVSNDAFLTVRYALCALAVLNYLMSTYHCRGWALLELCEWIVLP